MSPNKTFVFKPEVEYTGAPGRPKICVTKDQLSLNSKTICEYTGFGGQCTAQKLSFISSQFSERVKTKRPWQGMGKQGRLFVAQH